MGLEKAGRLLLHLRPSYRRGRGSPLRRRPDVDELLDLGLLCKTPPHEYLMRWRSLEPAHPGLRTVPRRRKDRDSTTTPDHWIPLFAYGEGFWFFSLAFAALSSRFLIILFLFLSLSFLPPLSPIAYSFCCPLAERALPRTKQRRGRRVKEAGAVPAGVDLFLHS